MTRLISFFISLVFVLPSSFGQDVFNLENSKRFAEYLYNSGQFDLASDEFERVIFLDEKDSISMYYLISSYRIQKDYKIGLKRAMDLFPETQALERPILNEIFQTSILAKDFNYAESLIKGNTKLDRKDYDSYHLSLLVLDKKWDDAKTFVGKAQTEQSNLYNTVKKSVMAYDNIRQKSPFVAGALSTIVPGLGKVYTNNWKDGLVSLLFVATNGWQAYRGFANDGIKSTYGWVFGTVATGFWIGNIYGSVKSAKDYNHQKKKIYYEDASKVIYNGL